MRFLALAVPFCTKCEKTLPRFSDIDDKVITTFHHPPGLQGWGLRGDLRFQRGGYNEILGQGGSFLL